MKIETGLMIFFVSVIIVISFSIFYNLYFLNTNNVECFDFYAEQYCKLNNMTWNGYRIIPFPSSGFICLQKLGSERLGFKDYEKHFFFSKSKKEECTNKPLISWSK